jgi:hypothetical protein
MAARRRTVDDWDKATLFVTGAPARRSTSSLASVREMRTLRITLKCLAPALVLVGMLHLILGLGADAMLGAKITSDVMSDPALDSQNRFYGVSFTIYGVLCYLCATDIPKYAPVLRCIFYVFFAAGLARLISIAVRGVPSLPVLVLLTLELLGPPALLWLLWKQRAELAQSDRDS